MKENKDTLLCFTVPQAKYIAQELSNGWYADSIASAYASRDDVAQKLLVEKDHRLELEKKTTVNLKNQIDLKEEQRIECMQAVGELERKNNMLKSFARGGLVFGIVGILFGLVK